MADPWLPARLEREVLVRKGEKRVQTAATAYIGQALAVADRAFNRKTGHLDNALLDARDLDDGPLLRVIGAIHSAAYTEGLTAAASVREATAAYLALVRNRLARVPDAVFDTIRAELATGFDTGESIPHLAARVGKMLANAGAEKWQGRAVTIARTETIGAFNAGHRAGTYGQAAAVGMNAHDVVRQWLATADSRTRQSHAEADGQQVQGEHAHYQLAGGDVLFPGDPAGPPEEVINCRCTEQVLFPGDPAYPVTASASPPPQASPGPTVPPEEATMTTTPTQAAEQAPGLAQDIPTTGPPLHGVLAPEGVRTGDGRSFAVGSMRWRDLPLPLRVQNADAPGHEGSIRVARIDQIWRDDTGDFPRIRFTGTWATDATGTLTQAAMAARDEVVAGVLRGVSVDLDDTTVEFLDAETGQPQAEEADGDMLEALFGDPGMMNVTDGRISGATMCSIPAFQEAFVADGVEVAGEPEPGAGSEVPIVSQTTAASIEAAIAADAVCAHDDCDAAPTMEVATDDPEVSVLYCADHAAEHEGEALAVAPAPPIGKPMRGLMPDGETECSCDEADPDFNPDCVCGEAASGRGESFHLTAAAAPVYSADDFANPQFTTADPHMAQATDGTWGCPLTITDAGNVYGHLAKWGTCHIGFDGVCVTPPMSEASYAYFATGSVDTDAGTIPVGPITLGTGHAAATLGHRPAVAHYDDTGNAVADVAMGEDEFGIWYAGRLRPGVTDEQVTTLRHGGALSGDWRRIGGSLELVAALAVNTPGFPVPRRMLAASGGVQTSLVAAGMVGPAPLWQTATSVDVDLVTRDVLARLDRRDRAARLARRVGRDPASRIAAAAARIEGGI